MKEENRWVLDNLGLPGKRPLKQVLLSFCCQPFDGFDLYLDLPSSK